MSTGRRPADPRPDRPRASADRDIDIERAQERSIRDRKSLIYDDEPTAAPTGPSKPFADHVRETPAAPLSGEVKAMLWAAGVVVVLLLIGALLKSTRSKPLPPPPKASSAARWARFG